MQNSTQEMTATERGDAAGNADSGNADSGSADSAGTVEFQTIYPIPESQRHGRARDLFAVWFGTNMTMLSVATGAVALSAFHLTPLTALAAVLLGNAVGGVLMALHAAQGPQLGIPQMVQARAQFGMIGAAPMTALIVVMFLGFSASNLVLGAQGLAVTDHRFGGTAGMLILAALSLIPAALGYRAIHAATRAASWLCGAAVLLCLAASLRGVPHEAGWWRGAGADTPHGFLGAMSIGALWQIAYAPYVSDYSRYLPRTRTGEAQAFWATWSGSVASSFITMAVGVIVGANVSAALSRELGPAGPPVLGILSLGLVVANAMTLYCGALSSITVLHTLLPQRHFGKGWRIGLTIALLLASAAIAIPMAESFDEAYAGFLELLMAIMVPWSSINLVDYYILRHGSYDIPSFFAADGGVYGRFNVPALLSYVAGLAFQVPFLATSFYQGPIARLFGGADLSWVAGLLVTAVLYLAAVRKQAITE